MDRSLMVESTPQIDFGDTQDEDVDETSREGYVGYSEHNFTDFFHIPDYNNIDKDQHSSCSDNKSDIGTKESETNEVLPKKWKRENNSKWSVTKPKSKRRSACDVVKGTPGPRLDACLVKNELEAFLSYINENMITKIVEITNDQMYKICKKINADEFLFRYSDTNEEKLNVYLDCFTLEACTTIPSSQQKSSGMTRFLQGKYTGQQCH